MNKILIIALFLIPFSSILAQHHNKLEKIKSDNQLMVRVAEIEIYPEYLEEYIAILKEESEASVKLEPGVICIYPMYQKENPTQIRFLEIYADSAAYQSHLQTQHFQHYKTTTLPMVKSLELIDMEPIDKEIVNVIFKKTNQL